MVRSTGFCVFLGAQKGNARCAASHPHTPAATTTTTAMRARRRCQCCTPPPPTTPLRQHTYTIPRTPAGGGTPLSFSGDPRSLCLPSIGVLVCMWGRGVVRLCVCADQREMSENGGWTFRMGAGHFAGPYPMGHNCTARNSSCPWSAHAPPILGHGAPPPTSATVKLMLCFFMRPIKRGQTHCPGKIGPGDTSECVNLNQSIDAT